MIPIDFFGAYGMNLPFFTGRIGITCETPCCPGVSSDRNLQLLQSWCHQPQPSLGALSGLTMLQLVEIQKNLFSGKWG